MLFSIPLTAILSLLFTTTAAIFNIAGSSNMVIYWGQNSQGSATSQSRLSTYCAMTTIDIIPLSFLVGFHGTGGYPVLNFANAGTFCTIFPGTNMLDCPQIAADITTCQVTYGKKILLSMGGSAYSEGGFSGADTAVSTANMIWTLFGPKMASSNLTRPFGNAVLDGFDFDFESFTNHLIPFAQQLRSLMDTDEARTGKQWLLSAAPQCSYPDANLGYMMNSVCIDLVFVQFYNNPQCSPSGFVAGIPVQPTFNMAIWDTWARTISANKAVRIFLGVPASPIAAGSGYLSPNQLAPVIKFCKTFKSFAGIMMWDASTAIANTGFLISISTILKLT